MRPRKGRNRNHGLERGTSVRAGDEKEGAGADIARDKNQINPVSRGTDNPERISRAF